MKKFYPLVFINCICVCIFIILSTVSCGKRHDFYIFENISECQGIQNSTLSGAKFEHYEIEKDKKLKGLTYTERFCGKFSCDEFEFEIFAYEFENAESAKKYFDNVTGTADNIESYTSFYGNFGMFSVDIMVFDFEKAYRVNLSKSDIEEVFQFLSTVFSKKIATA